MTDRSRPTRARRAAYLGLALAVTLTAVSSCGQDSPSPGTGQSSTTQSAAPSSLTASLPGSGTRMISRAGHRLAFHVIDGHRPAIVLDAGGGEDSSHWKDLAPVLAEQTGSMVVSYDRAGLGESDEVPGPWKVQDAVADLAAGLTALGITDDVILVSHSQAGEIATYFAKQYPQWISGAVLVDGSVPQFYTDAEIARIEAANSATIESLKNQPSTKQTRQLQATAADYGPMHHAYHQISWPQQVPAVVIVSADTPFPTPEDAQRWRDAAREFAQAAPNRQLVTADRSSHDVAHDRPDVIVAAVREVSG